ncbi:RND transporter, Hydrophobe/Amphiphile Efflux-1 (HAE1)/Heavy Metal Efflux (HME) family, permease domain protein [Leptospira interrogans str. L1207]|nr:RND transporter, Hydrophobe/Amphiphile Efflux-1 (HAE1)/Heavy Metal Efflux (HME) family, permease domain protein [Leptospira interrogans str. L1207]
MTTLGIPVSFGATFVIMDYLGLTLNLISMFGLIIVVGILVDDAIIICENVYRYMEEGMPRLRSCVKRN